MTNTSTSANTLFSYLPFEATREQAEALYHLEEFLDPACGDDLFILRGAAGTGKTSLVKALVDYLDAQKAPCYLSAPTGRAAKVLGHKTRSVAYTIHRTIYRVIPTNNETVVMERRSNSKREYSIYIVDEASMISDAHSRDESFKLPNSLLFDLITYVKEGNGRNKIVFIGDRYQLAPINGTESPALNIRYFESKYRLSGRQFELTEVKRQLAESPVLAIAHDIRRRSDEKSALGNLNLPLLNNASQAADQYCKLYNPKNLDRVIIIGYYNRNVHNMNMAVRRKLRLTGLLTVGDKVIVNENWIDEQRMIVNGEIGIVREINGSIEKRAALEFITATIEFTAPSGECFRVTTKVMLDPLKTEDGKLANEQVRYLKHDRMAQNQDYRINPHPANDPYMGAMRLRYGHAISCHRAQGGEWDHVLMSPYYIENDYRYAYTATTRARESVTSWVKK